MATLSTTESNTFDYTGGIVDITVDVTGYYNITADGAQGGSAFGGAGGEGASASAEVLLQAGATLEIVVGGEGAAGGVSRGAGGGGGSFVIQTGPVVDDLVIAGGGGGATTAEAGEGGRKQSSGGTGGSGGGAGGAGGAPGGEGFLYPAGGGGGFTGGVAGQPGGDTGATFDGAGDGGFGGGGGGADDQYGSTLQEGGGGGGGGYGGGGGGGGGSYAGGGGGGGSFEAAGAIESSATAANHTGDGAVTIQFASVAPKIGGAGKTTYAVAGSTNDKPFAGVTISDTNGFTGSKVETVTITLSDPNASLTLSSSSGGGGGKGATGGWGHIRNFPSGGTGGAGGSTNAAQLMTSATAAASPGPTLTGGDGVYTLTASDTEVTNALHRITLSAPSQLTSGASNGVETLTFSLSDSSSADPSQPATATQTADILAPGSVTFGYTGGVETITVPTSGYYDVIADGAQGGAGGNSNQSGGLGAMAGGDIFLQGGEQLDVIVGGAGKVGLDGGGGGGGSFVFTTNGAGGLGAPLVIAGGGGGATVAVAGGGGRTQASGGSGGALLSGAGGTDGGAGEGGEAGDQDQQPGGGGGGYAGGAGGAPAGGPGETTGASFQGGKAAGADAGGGGFGGGGGGGYGGGGGGGGGSGLSGSLGDEGGGGGSFVVAGASDVSKTAATQSGNGFIEFVALGIPCYCPGSLILTDRGEVAVERLQIGDVVVTASGALRPIRWIGHRTLEPDRYPERRDVLPVRIAAHAFGANRPRRDLMVSPGHALCVDVLGEVLVPAASLINGSTIRQIEVERVAYWHVELDSHDILLAENLPAESYLDMGNRTFFNEGAVVDFHGLPDDRSEQRTHADFCRPFHSEGALVEAIRLQMRARALTLGWMRSCELELHLEIDGDRIDPVIRDLTARFYVPGRSRDVWLVSPSARPSDTLDERDDRELGLCVRALYIDDGFSPPHAIALDDPGLDVGFHAFEKAEQRWTNGRAKLSRALWSGREDGFFLRVDLAAPPVPRWLAPAGRYETRAA